LHKNLSQAASGEGLVQQLLAWITEAYMNLAVCQQNKTI
jgi:hypothetical protein